MNMDRIRGKADVIVEREEVKAIDWNSTVTDKLIESSSLRHVGFSLGLKYLLYHILKSCSIGIHIKVLFTFLDHV